MNDDIDFSNLSDEELRAYIDGKDISKAAPGAGSRVAEEKRAGYEALIGRAPKTQAEEIEPSAFKRGAAAMGGRMREPFVGLAEKFELAFPGAKPATAEATRQRVGLDRSNRRDIQQGLEETTAGQFGGFAGQALPFAAAPLRVLPQAALAGGIGFLTGGADRPGSFGGEMASSGFSGAVDAAATGSGMGAVKILGKAVSGARGRYTPEGAEAMELDAAARRMGLPRTTVGQLDPLAPEALRAHPELAIQQARALEQRLASQRTVPNPAGGTMEQTVPGGRLKQGLEDAINVRRQQARGMYAAVDDFASNQGLSNVDPNYTLNVLSSANRLTPSGKQPTGNNIVYNLLDTYDPDAFAWMKTAGSVKNAKANGMTMTQYHDARVAVGRSLNSLDRKNPADLTSDQIDAKKILIDLKKALDNDVERWAKTNSKNQEAVDLYNRAKDFYATTAADATNNPLARKIASKSRGFQSSEQMYNALINPSNRTLSDRLLPTASRETADALRVLQDLPDVGAVVARGSVPSGGASRELGALARGAMGHPGLAAIEMTPGLRWLSSTNPAKRAYFGAPPTNRALGPAVQYPAGGLEMWARERTSTDRGR